MKKSSKISMLLSSVMLLGLYGCNNSGEETSSNDSAESSEGVQGTGAGYHGDIVAEVTFSGDQIEAIEIIEENENESLAEPVFTEMRDAMVEQNSTDVDSISGATGSSEGFKEAVEDAIEQAGVTLSSSESADSSSELEDEYNFDVVVVGGGGAGFS
ncbi:MAG TPA: FMN-binding protein, partial [Alloiococcus sp.]|nr:FMN-binding protein [Alloiococcus sp.]